MCLIFLSLQQHPHYKLVIAANRDEFYQRKTAPANYWDDHPEILGGRDLEAKGTWMAMNRNGRVAMVTNYRDLKNIKIAAPSRGALVTDYLLTDESSKEYLEKVEQKSQAYNGFNLIVGSAEELWYHSNYKPGVHAVSHGLHGLSNHLLDTPWPKVERGIASIKSVLANREIDPGKLFEVLTDEKVATDNTLPDTGIGLERERALSAMFIKSPGYGTRCSTVVLVDKSNNAYFAERVYDLKTFAYTQNAFSFTIES